MELEEGYYWVKISSFQRQSWEICYWIGDGRWMLVDEYHELESNRIVRIGPRIEPPSD